MSQIKQPQETSMPARIIMPLRKAAVVLILLAGVLAFWAGTAELATTIRVPGYLSTDTPSHDIQSEMAGSLESIKVTLFDRVEEGQLLFRFDRKREENALAALKRQRARILGENRDIQTLLSDDPAGAAPVGQAARLQVRLLVEKLASLSDKADCARQAIVSANDEKSALLQILELLEDQIKQQKPLVDKGISQKSTLTSLRERKMNIKARLAGLQARLTNLHGTVRSAAQDAKTLKANEQFDLATSLENNTKLLDDLKNKISQLEMTIAQGTILAPVGGSITAIEVATPGSFVATGQIMATISQPITAPVLELRVPVIYVDQVSAGQTGTVTLNAFPQRDLPPLEIDLVDIAAEAVLDRDGIPLYYLASARFQQSELETARDAMGDSFRLAINMPVSATLNGPTSTLISYLLRPLKSISDAAFES